MLRVAAVNQDRGISPGRNKGAAVHLVAMRDAFTELGAQVIALDDGDDSTLEESLDSLHREAPLDLVYERYALGKSTASRFTSNQDIPHVLEVNAPLADEQERYRGRTETGQDQEQDRFIFSNANQVLAVSTAVGDYARSRGADNDSVRVCPNGIDTRRFNKKVDGTVVRKQLLPEDKIVLGFHGRLRPWHGFEQLVDSVGHLLSRKFPVHLFVIGEGDFTQLQHLPAASYTKLGWQSHEQIPELIAAFDLLPLCYQPETPCYFSPLKLMEAMACGVVPLVPDMGDLPHTISHGITGMVYPAGDMKVMEQQIVTLATQAAQRLSMGNQAAEEAAGYSWLSIARSVFTELGFESNPVGALA
ncbi:MAG: glycosyltransferase family 4 protein [Pirellulaceae bacterium]